MGYILLLCLLLSGCASTPKETYHMTAIESKSRVKVFEANGQKLTMTQKGNDVIWEVE